MLNSTHFHLIERIIWHVLRRRLHTDTSVITCIARDSADDIYVLVNNEDEERIEMEQALYDGYS